MKFISHRGNLNGSNKLTENTIEQIKYVIGLGHDCEIDLWYINNKIYLGHDKAENIIDLNFLLEYKKVLWCHCKNWQMLEYFNVNKIDVNYFWHQNDDYTLTSRNYIWTYPGKFYTPKSVIVMPETYLTTDLSSLVVYNAYGVCTDYPNKLKK